MAKTVNGYVPECRPADADLSPLNRIYQRTGPVFLVLRVLDYVITANGFIGTRALHWANSGSWRTTTFILRTPSCRRTATSYGSSATRFLENKGVAVKLSPAPLVYKESLQNLIVSFLSQWTTLLNFP
jgi:hypothetical protein